MKYLFMLLIQFYRKCISPLKPPCCRFYPTCSCYALEAVRKHGAVKGTFLAVKRLLRCHPWNIGGIDHVPDEFPGFIRKKRPKSSSKCSDSIYPRKGNHIS